MQMQMYEVRLCKYTLPYLGTYVKLNTITCAYIPEHMMYLYKSMNIGSRLE